MIKATILTLLAYALLLSNSFAGLPIKYLVNVKGKCTKAIYFNQNKIKQCEGNVINTAFNNGRTSFTYKLNLGLSIGFSGGKDFQPKKNEYVLLVDKVTITSLRSGKKINKFNGKPVKGKCIMKGDPMSSASWYCKAISSNKILEFKVQQYGKPNIYKP